MTPHYTDPMLTLYLGDCLEVMPTLPDASVDAVVTDPPYSLGFMGRAWDKNLNHGPWAAECYRLLKPGGHLLAFGGTRTYHRLASAIEDAGFEIRDCLVWAYASGFPKSLDVGKAIDRAAGAEREVVGEKALTKLNPYEFAEGHAGTVPVTAPATDDAKRWDGWGTALKPAWEPIVMARKPLQGTVAANVLRHGTGALNIDGTRIGWASPEEAAEREAYGEKYAGRRYGPQEDWPKIQGTQSALGRWPANVILTDPIFDGDTPGVVGGGWTTSGDKAWSRRGSERHWEGGVFGDDPTPYPGDTGTYSRFFLIAKEARAGREPAVRGETLEYEHSGPRGHSLNGDGTPRPRPRPRTNLHPTVKPLELMRHLVRLVTPPGGLILDPFLGSGTTALAAINEGFRCIGIEREAEYMAITMARLPGTQTGIGL